MKIAFFDAKSYDKIGFDKYAKDHSVTIKYFETKLTEDTVNLANGFDGVCVFVNDTVNKEVIDKLVENKAKFIALRCAGYNNVDIEYCYGKIHVFHVPAYSPYAVAEHAIALLLTSVRRIHKAYIRTKDFNFSLHKLDGFDLHGKTVGVIGTGKIGQCFINICRGFGMNILCFDKYPNKDIGAKYVPLSEIFKKCDVISLHCPLTDETKYMINATSIESMKKGVVIINTSRGALIDTDALIDGIKARKVGAACLDVYEEESDFFFRDFSGHIVQDDTLARLISMPNVIVTGHQAYLTKEALDNIAETTIGNITSFHEKGSCPNELCYHCGKIDNCKSKGIEKCF